MLQLLVKVQPGENLYRVNLIANRCQPGDGVHDKYMQWPEGFDPDEHV